MAKIEKIDGLMLKKAFNAATNNLDANKEYVNSLNVFPVPDGDTGTNMYMTLKSATDSITSTDKVSEVMKSVSRGALMGARGNSGVILSQILRGMYVGLEDLDEAKIEDLNKSFQESKKSAYKAVMKPTEGTILTVVRAVAECSQEIYSHHTDVIVYLQKLLAHGNSVLDKTPDMLKELKDAGLVDAGGKGYLIILEGLIHGLLSDEVDYEVNVDNFNFFADKENHNPDEIKYGYCTEFMINGEFKDYEKFRDEISNSGDSVIVVNDTDITKVHIHTNHPGDIIEKALNYGYLTDIKIDNMKMQVSNKEKNISPSVEEKDFDFIVVSSGEGINEIFTSLGVNYIVEGGQTMNPSTEDLLEAVNQSNAKDIYIFPNNKNIIMSAKQVKDLSDKNIELIETRYIPEAFTALLAFNPDLDSIENQKNMTDAIEEVDTIQITHSIRDSLNNGIEIKKDDYIGLVNGDIKEASDNIEELASNLIEQTIKDDNYLITIYAGEDIRESEAEALYKKVEDKYEDFDVEIIDGKQPIYKYIISIE